MAQFETIEELVKWTGKIKKSEKIVARQKTYRYPDGRIFGLGPKEMYAKERRDYKRHPRKGAELQQAEKWRAACRLAMEISKNPQHPRYEELYNSWLAQLGGQKAICQFGNYVRSVLMKS